MARYITHPQARSLWAGGIVAGIAGGFLIHAFLFAVGIAHYPATYQWIASGLIGKSAFTNADGAVIGVLLHFAISIVAAIVYAYAGQFTGLLGRPLLAGTIFGVVMNALMDLAAFERTNTPLPSGLHDVGIGLVAHVVFFGIPIALFLSRYERVMIPYTK